MKGFFMEENYTQSSTKKEKISNFWYYHKWHTIVAIFLIITLLICTLQMCKKTTYDIHVMYAGSHEFKRTATNGDLPPYGNALSSLKFFADDYDENGEINVDFLDLYLLTTSEIQELELEKGTDINYVLLNNNRETFLNNLMYSEFYVCFISPALYEAYKTVSDVSVFTSLEKYLDDGAAFTLSDKSYVIENGTKKEAGESEGALSFYDECAIRLSSTSLSSMPEFSSLPSDTLICLRIKSAIASHFNKSENERLYKNSEAYLREILNSK